MADGRGTQKQNLLPLAVRCYILLNSLDLPTPVTEPLKNEGVTSIIEWLEISMGFVARALFRDTFEERNLEYLHAPQIKLKM